MDFHFDQVIDRRKYESIKWMVGENELPMWVADMDFEAAPCIRKTLKERVEHGIFGYTAVPDAWYEAYCRWWSNRHGLAMEKDWLMFVTGVVPAISSIVRKLTTPDEKVIVQTPVYNIFFNSILNNGCRILDNPLLYENGEYRMDFDDLEAKMSDPQATLMILCNPQNPAGKIWDRQTLARIGELADRHHVKVISDEIHCDITQPGTEYVPFAGASELCRKISITCIAPTKAFNLAGLQSAAIAVPDPFLRHKVMRAINTDEVAEPNAFACEAAVSAFTEGGPWLDAMREYVWENRRTAEEMIGKELPDCRPVKADATYLMWLDISAVGDSDKVAAFLREKTGLFVTAGISYGEAGRGFLRINLACPRSVMQDGITRLIRGIKEYNG